jgi:HK97 family phage portal protein
VKIVEWLRGLFETGKDKIEITADSLEQLIENQQREITKFHTTEIALFTVIDLIAKTLAKCEFITAENRKEVKKNEYYSWNFAPNKHQTKAEFITMFISTLLFKGEALIFETSDGQRLIADSFSKTEYAYFDDTFTGVTARNMNFNQTFYSKDVIYLKYNNSALKNILFSMGQSYESLMESSQKRYNKAVGHKGILEIENSALNTTDQQEKFNDLMNNKFKAYFKADNAVLPIYDGYKYSEPSTDASKTTNNEINDLTKLKSEIFETVANAFHIPPSIIKGEASQLSDAVDTFIANAVDPLAQMLEQEITKKVYGEKGFIKGNYLLIDTTKAKHIDAITSANNLDKSIASGILSPEKAQSYCNMLPTDEEYAKHHYMTKNYQTADLAVAVKGGESNAKKQI